MDSVFIVLLSCLSVTMGQPLSGASIDELISAAAGDVAGFDVLSHLSSGTIRQELDIVLTIDQWKTLNGHTGSDSGRKKRKATRDLAKRWPNKVVPYRIEGDSFSYADREVIHRAMRTWEDYTCITFRYASSYDHNFVMFTSKGGCSSSVGMQGGEQVVSLSYGCRQHVIVVHEIGHALGFWHEHNRPDRDAHVDIHLENVSPHLHHNFNKYSYAAVNNHDVPYDYLSIMHYGSRSATLNLRDTIVAKDPAYRKTMGLSQDLSFYDIMAANRMYSCDENCGSSVRCPGNAYRGKDCKCYCKGSDQLVGTSSSPTLECSSTDTRTPVPARPTRPTRRPPRTQRPQVTRRPVEQCSDQNKNCPGWAASPRGHCRTSTYMRDYCRQSCDLCDVTGAVMTTPPPAETCADTSDRCGDYRHLCKGINYWVMEEMCARTCGHCTPVTSQGGKSRPSTDDERSGASGGGRSSNRDRSSSNKNRRVTYVRGREFTGNVADPDERTGYGYRTVAPPGEEGQENVGGVNVSIAIDSQEKNTGHVVKPTVFILLVLIASVIYNC